MLDLSKLDFRIKPDPEIPGGLRLIGTMIYRAWRIIDPVERRAWNSGETKDPSEFWCENVRHQMWSVVYGDLIRPIRELQSIARATAWNSPYDQRVQELCDELNRLLDPKTASGKQGG